MLAMYTYVVNLLKWVSAPFISMLGGNAGSIHQGSSGCPGSYFRTFFAEMPDTPTLGGVPPLWTPPPLRRPCARR